jgi:FMN phosphatase YigB (HAD superfamily)
MKYVIVDIDRTLADCKHRTHYVERKPKNYEAFFEEAAFDAPIKSMCNLVNVLIKSGDYEIVFCTGRPESIRQTTVEWLSTHLHIDESDISMLMRPNKNYFDDSIVKPKLLSKQGINPSNTEFILDDKQNVVDAFRNLGFKVLQVAEGNF